MILLTYQLPTFIPSFCLDQEGEHWRTLGLRDQKSSLRYAKLRVYTFSRPRFSLFSLVLGAQVEKQSNKQTRPIQNPSSGTELNEPTYRNRYRGSNPLLMVVLYWPSYTRQTFLVILRIYYR